jgi:hypothetical protein
MTSAKYIAMDVHKESISMAVMNAVGKIVMECVIETKANMIVQCIDGLRGVLVQWDFRSGQCTRTGLRGSWLRHFVDLLLS